MDLFCLVLLTVKSTVSIFSGIAELEKRLNPCYLLVILKGTGLESQVARLQIRMINEDCHNMTMSCG